MITTQNIDLTRITPTQFEELIFKLVRLIGYEQVRWRQGAADNGRDIQAIKYIKNTLIGPFEETWFFEAKHYSSGVPPAEFNSKFAWADAEKPKHLAFFLSSHISNNGNSWLEQRSENLPYKVHLIQGNELKEILLSYPNLLREFELVDNHVNIIQLVVDNWVIKNTLPNWHSVLLTLMNSNLDLVSINEKLLLANLMLIHNGITYLWDEKSEEMFMDNLHPIIELVSDELVKSTENDIELNGDFWADIEWNDQQSYGTIELAENEEELWKFGIVNLVRFRGEYGILSILTNWEDNHQTLKLIFIARDSSLSITNFEKLDSGIEAFLIKYEEEAPKRETKLLSEDFWEWEGKR